MKANELRIGNYVNDKYADGTLYEVQVGIQQIEYPHDCQPIKLNEEWIEKFGFKKDYEYFNLKELSIKLINDDWVYCFYMYDDYHSVNSAIAIIQHVHDLQNLYFAIKGEELTLKYH